MIARNVETDLLVYDVSAVLLCVTTAKGENGQEIEIRGRKGEVDRENDFAVVQTSNGESSGPRTVKCHSRLSD